MSLEPESKKIIWQLVEGRKTTNSNMPANFEYSYDLKKLTFVYFGTCLCFLNIFSLPNSKVQFVFHLYMALSFVFLFSYKQYYCLYALSLIASWKRKTVSSCVICVKYIITSSVLYWSYTNKRKRWGRCKSNTR